MSLLEKLFSFIILINYNEKMLMQNRNFLYLINFPSFSVLLFFQITSFYWKIVFKISNLLNEYFFFNSIFLPRLFQYLMFLYFMFDLMWYWYLYCLITTILFFSFPVFLYQIIKNRIKLEINELKYKLALIFFLIVGNKLQNSLNLLIIILIFELMTALKLFW
jgi:hypothetical protein